ncbi:head-tail connector protein [Mesorhizobium sp. SP-1A]|uniref:head-tail connector protein n=1 Tax=Mesorhizobium sp. SP-1A TaxID=3077840 RepID=UPI0028F6DF4D|nr:head-tail connector protein [Mesorhizobium sp. SP-1A]
MAIVTLADAKAHLGITDTTDDALITAKIDASQAWLEQMLGYVIATEFPDTVPADLVEAVKQVTAHFYENRESTVAGLSILSVPMQVEDTIRNRRHYSWADNA